MPVASVDEASATASGNAAASDEITSVDCVETVAEDEIEDTAEVIADEAEDVPEETVTDSAAELCEETGADEPAVSADEVADVVTDDEVVNDGKEIIDGTEGAVDNETNEVEGMTIDGEDDVLDKEEVNDGKEIIDGVEDNERIDGIEPVGSETDSDANTELNIITIHSSIAAINRNLVFFIKITFLFFFVLFSLYLFLLYERSKYL